MEDVDEENGELHTFLDRSFFFSGVAQEEMMQNNEEKEVFWNFDAVGQRGQNQ